MKPIRNKTKKPGTLSEQSITRSSRRTMPKMPYSPTAQQLKHTLDRRKAVKKIAQAADRPYLKNRCDVRFENKTHVPYNQLFIM